MNTDKVILTTRVGKSELILGICLMLVSVMGTLFMTLFVKEWYVVNFILIGMFGIIGALGVFGYFMMYLIFYEDGRIVFRDMFGIKREIYKRDVAKIRVTTRNGNQRITLFNEENKKILTIYDTMPEFDQIYPIVREYHVPIEFHKYVHKSISKRTWENKE